MTDHLLVSFKISQKVQNISACLAEMLRFFAIYLGMAVIVLIFLTGILPDMRHQLSQMHQAILSIFSPTPFNSSVQLATAAHHPTTLNFISTTFMTLSEQPSVSVPTRTKASHSANSSQKTLSESQLEILRGYIARKYKIAYDATALLVKTTYKVSQERRLDPLLLLAVIAIESRYNPFAESAAGAQGLMQVMTHVHQDKFDVYGKNAALDPLANIRVGSAILRNCIMRRGSINAGLSCYVGATGPNDNGYSSKVLAERRRLALVAGISLD